FFSSRRRHTRFSRDWSSDVCSSDLIIVREFKPVTHRGRPEGTIRRQRHVVNRKPLNLRHFTDRAEGTAIPREVLKRRLQAIRSRRGQQGPVRKLDDAPWPCGNRKCSSYPK